MLKDITIGQYFPGNSILHRLDPRAKLIAVFLYIITLFVNSSWLANGILLAVTIIAMAFSLAAFAAFFRSSSATTGITKT